MKPLQIFAVSLVVMISACSTPGPTGPAESRAHSEGAIVFLARTMGPATQIQTVQESGASDVVLESTHWRDLHPDVGPAGQLVFMSNRRAGRDVDLSKYRESFQIFLTDLSGEGIQPLTDFEHSALTPKLSPDGNSLAYILAEPEGAELYWQQSLIAQSEPESLLSARDILDFDWSPTNDSLAVVAFDSGNSRIEFIALEPQADKASIRAPEGSAITSVSWSPSGEHLAYVVNRTEGSRQLYLYDWQTEQSRRVSAPDNHVQQPVRWSPDGQRLLYSSLVDFEFFYDEQAREQVYRGGMHLFIASLTGPEQQLSDGDNRHGMPVFSPDAQRIAYLYAEQIDTRKLALRTMDLDGKNIKTLHDNVATESYLQWLPLPNSNRR